MNPRALHFPERRGIGRWAFSGVAIVATHAALIAALVLWYARTPPEDNIIPAIAVSLVSAASSSPQIEDQNVAIGPPMEEVEQTPPVPPKIEEQNPIEPAVEPPPFQQAEVTLPKPKSEPTPVKKPKPAPRPPAEARAAPRSERVAQFSQAAASAYNSLVYGHLQRYKRYPASARGASGTVVVRFALKRAGDVVSRAVTKSSGNDALDQEALAVLHRANPFPAFPAEKSGSQDSFVGAINFSQ
jgi:protein TonB